MKVNMYIKISVKRRKQKELPQSKQNHAQKRITKFQYIYW